MTIVIPILIVLVTFAVCFVPFLLIGFMLDNYESRKKRDRFKISFLRAYSDTKDQIAFTRAKNLAIKAKAGNIHAAEALEELAAEEQVEKSIKTTIDELERLAAQFRIDSKFTKIPDSIRGDIDTLKSKIGDGNASMHAIEAEIQKISIREKRFRLISILLALIGVIGTVYTILGYYEIVPAICNI